MIDFTRAELTHLIVHYVGNKGLGEELTLSEACFEFKDDFVKETVLRYFQTPFKTDIYHQFRSKSEFNLKDVKAFSESIFESRKNFIKSSKDMARHLYDQSMHPKIKGGEFYVCFFKDVTVDGELCDTIGCFKTENKETYLKVYQHVDAFDIDCDNGINIHKLDKGALIYNTEAKNGYKMSIVDTNNKVAECAAYWEYDFLNATLKENAYYHTSNFIESCRGFCEEVLTEGNNVNKQDQMMMLNKSASYFKERDKFNVKEFEKEVMVEPELIKAFKDYRKDFNDRLDLTAIDEFDVSPTAVKKNQKYMRSVVKLDKNFHVYIHGRHDYVERGFDEEKGMKYYKLYYTNEE
ncbi:MAG: nucleoid-associated protein [Bacteroidia bacterium]